MIHLRSLASAICWGMLILALAGCSEPAPGDRADPTSSAESDLQAYFLALHAGHYDQAASYFFGNYDDLASTNPDIDPQDLAALLQRWCTQNGGVCLPIANVVERTTGASGEFLFVVEFQQPDGGIFQIGPCCGEVDTGKRTRRFTYTVVERQGRWGVLELPPFVP
jgi:hypothetical protein